MPEYKELYMSSLTTAIRSGELEDWRTSHKENCCCARDIEKTINAHYADNCLGECAKEIIEQYGFARVNWVLANTVQEKKHDGRFSPDNKNWANGFYIPREDNNWHFAVEAHPGLTDLFIGQTRRAWNELGMYNASHCYEKSNDNLDYTGKVLILNGDVLKDEFKMPEFQLFYATGGFGCSPTSSGRKVFGYFLKDDEKATFMRSDFCGIIKEECLPEWAKEKICEVQTEAEDDAMTMGGM